MDESPVNRGAICAKGHAAPQWVYSPDRLTHPLKRVGARGTSHFARISWDEALDTIAGEFERVKAKYGNSALFVPYGTGSYNQLNGSHVARRLMNLYGGCLGIWHSYPFSYYGDEVHFVERALSFGSFDFNPHWFHKPAF